MAFGREGGTRLGNDSGVYASRQDSNGNAPHWMKQLEEKYQRLHAKIVNQAAKFSNARFNAANNNTNPHRSLSYGNRNSTVSKSSISSSGVDANQSILTKRESTLSNGSAFNNNRGLTNNTDTNNAPGRDIKTGGKRRKNADKSLILERSASANRGVVSFPVSLNASRRQSKISSEVRDGSVGSGEEDSGLTSSSTPPPHELNQVNTQPEAYRPVGDAGRVTQVETGDPVQATLAKTSAAIALLNSSPANHRPGESRRKSKGCTSGSRLKSPRRYRLRKQTLEPEQTHEDEDGKLSECVYYIPAGTDTSGGGYSNSKNKTIYCFENEVSGGASAQNTPRASKPTTRASSSLALTRLSSANFVSVSRAHSRLNEEVLDSANPENDPEFEEKDCRLFTKRLDPLVPDPQQQFINNGDVNEANQVYDEDDDFNSEDSDGECYSCEDDSDFSGDVDGDVFIDETVDQPSQESGMEVARGKSRRHASRTVRPSVSRLGQKTHKSCPAYFWKSANPYANADDSEEEMGHVRLLKTAEQAEKGQAHFKKNKKNNLLKRDRRGNKSHSSKKNNGNIANVTKYKDNNNSAHTDIRTADIESNDNRKETYTLDENANDSSDNNPCFNTNDRNQHQHQRHKARSDSKGNISPVMGTLLPLTARAVEEGRMRVFARMSIEARHAVDETLREMEREEEKMDREKSVEKSTKGDSGKPDNVEMESTWNVSVMNQTSGTRGPSRNLDTDMVEGGLTAHAGDSQGSISSNNPHDDFYASGRLHNSNPNLLHAKNHPDLTHSPNSSITAYKRTPITGQRATGSRRLPQLSDLPVPPQTSSLPNPHARLPGIGSKSCLPLSYRETTFEITPPDFDIRFHHIISCQAEDRETPPPDIRQQSIDKCQQWLVRHNPR